MTYGNHLITCLLWLALTLITPHAQADLTSDLQGLSTELSNISTELSAIDLTSGSCAELRGLNTTLENYTAGIEALTAQLTSPLNLTATDLSSLDDLSNQSRQLADEALSLSVQLLSIEGIYEAYEYHAALSAMLRLSDDIGTVANRILEMADRILIMADNIGTMANRILITQQLQNTNIALVQAAILTTQQNMVSMSDSVSTIAYNLSLGQLKFDTQWLSGQMDSTELDETSMATQLAQLETSTTAVLGQAIQLYTLTMLSSQEASHYINGDTLTLLGDLSCLHRALAVALESYAEAVNTLAPLTDNLILQDATASMLRLSRDIALMSDRMIEMGDKIIVMADNIGIMAGRIVETQNIQQTNIELTQSSVLTAQATTLTVIRNFGL